MAGVVVAIDELSSCTAIEFKEAFSLFDKGMMDVIFASTFCLT